QAYDHSGLVRGIEENGQPIYLRLVRSDLPSNGEFVFIYQQEEWEVTDIVHETIDGFYTVKRVWKNCSDRVKEAVLLFEAITLFEPEFYLIPCVSYNGNQWGTGNEPKGLERDGIPWVFAYDRTGLPAATFSE